jgi:aldehyde dehydrogenase family 7 member A1
MLRSVLRGKVSSSLNTCRNASNAFSRYPFLAELGLEPTNAGVYNGTWSQGSGGVLTSINPSTNEPIAQVYQASAEDYHQTIAKMKEANKLWMSKPAPYRSVQ